MAAVAAELRAEATGACVERVTQPAPLEIALRLSTQSGRISVFAGCDGELSRVHLTQRSRQNPPRPPAFCMLLRKYLEGARVQYVTMPHGLSERVLEIGFESPHHGRLSLVLEIMGKHSNVILLNASSQILGSAKNIARDINRYREVLPGILYVPPPQQRTKLDPYQAFHDESADELSEADASTWLQQTFAGVSRVAAKEAVSRTNEQRTKTQLWCGLADLLTDVRADLFAPVVWCATDGNIEGAYPLSLTSIETNRQDNYRSISAAFEFAAEHVNSGITFDRSRDLLRTAIKRAITRRESERNAVELGLQNSSRASEYRETADLLLAFQREVVRGTTEAVLPDYFAVHANDEVVTRTICVDPKLNARENAEMYYKKARKAEDSEAHLTARKAQTENDLNVLVEADMRVDSATATEQLAALREHLGQLLGRQTLEPSSDNRLSRAETGGSFDGHKIKTFTSVDGWQILVGENATSNDYLTTKVASPSDIWLHVRAGASAHGVIRTQNRPGAVSTAALYYAAELVAARSESKHSSMIPVDYTLRKYVRKPRKSNPGAVTYEKEKTINVKGING